MQDVSLTDGKTYTMQYFERAVFEMHPENQAPYDVLLSLLGVFQFNKLYPQGAARAKASTDNADHVQRNRHDARRQVPRLLGEPWRPGPARLPYLQ